MYSPASASKTPHSPVRLPSEWTRSPVFNQLYPLLIAPFYGSLPSLQAWMTVSGECYARRWTWSPSPSSTTRIATAG